MKTTSRQAGFVLMGFVILLLLSFLTAAGDASPQADPATATSSESVRASFNDALASVQSDLDDMEQRLEQWDLLRNDTLRELEAFRIQNTVHENLLLSLHTGIEALASALNANRITANRLAERIEEFEKIGVLAPEWLKQLLERIAIAENRVDKLKHEGASGGQGAEMQEKLKSLLGILYEKRERGEAFLKSHTELFNALEQTNADLARTRGQLESRLQSQANTKLFKRHPMRFGISKGKSLSAELDSAAHRVTTISQSAFWKKQWLSFQYSGGTTQTIFLALFFAIIALRKRIWRLFQAAGQRLETSARSARWLALMLFRRSFLLICAAALLWAYDLLKLPHVNYLLARFLNQTIFTLLITQWGIVFFQNRLRVYNSGLNLLLQRRFVALFYILRMLIIANLTLIGIFGSESMAAWIFGLAIEAFLFFWTLYFWRAVDEKVVAIARQGERAPPRALLHTARVWSQLVVGFAILIDLIGYHALAGHWLVSWGKTFALMLWAYLGWLSINEWHLSQKTAFEEHPHGDKPIVAGPAGWLAVQMARFLWFAAIIAGFLMAWTGSTFTMASFGIFFGLNFSVGSLTVSVKGIVLAVILFFVTHAATRIGTRFLSEKVLDSKNFERGLKDSIITIFNYAVWGLGILIGLGLLGVNATSLAVVFGALSIGIGFGLQNIFNNFISGLILLFERPIQVGDYVEINGLWAEVKKIKVRATIVQTFDNATVIIPNSELISQQVTNWSFKDPRIRRHVDVGVAYGSDIELVRDTLLDIPEQIPEIMKYPKPDVLFLEHGDSALIFRLRFWTHVTGYYTPTTVRFALDHRFNELGIEIAFPQMDLHIRSDETKEPEKNADGSGSERSGPLPQGG